MNHRERFSAVFRGEKPDQMVWYGDMTYWHAAHGAKGDLPAEWQGYDGLFRLHHDLDIGAYINYGHNDWGFREGEDVRVETESTPQRIKRSWHTPVGSVTEVQDYSAASYSWGYTKHAVETEDDLRVLRYIIASRDYFPTYDRFAALDMRFAEEGFGPTHSAAPATPISELNKHWVGVLELIYLMEDCPEEFAEILRVMTEAHDKIYEIIAKGPAWHIMICENLTADTMGGFFDGYIAPHLRRWSKLLHDHGKVVMLHNDGTLRGTLEKLAAAGVDCVDAVTPKPVGDVAVEDLRKLAGDDILILGGMPGAIFAPPFTASDIEKHVRTTIDLHKDSGTFMFGVADQVPPDGDLNLVRLVGELIARYGRY